MYADLSVLAYVISVGREIYGRQERVSDTLNLELLAVVSCQTWVLGTKLGPQEQQEALLINELLNHRHQCRHCHCCHHYHHHHPPRHQRDKK